ncbi:MAG: 4Fe-4S dicluster domain-containing protein [Ignavibacteriales bacterium]|nr:4Fe-4S dicluster domain-containing protein [Ignavibacteriales bacterium]
MIVKVADFFTFLNRCFSEGVGKFDEIILPVKSSKENNNLHFASIKKGARFDFETVQLDTYRTIDPVKVLYYLSREKVLPAHYPPKRRLIIGVKSCDLRALEILDKAMINNEFVDQAYKHWRDNAIIISTDCLSITNTCHCTLTGGKPYSESGFDINLSKSFYNYHLTVGSQKGEELVEFMKKSITIEDDKPDILKNVANQRQEVIELLNKQNEEYFRSEDYSGLINSKLSKWETYSRECVGCGGCTNICPTCYCLILNDETKSEQFVKVRSYDSCQLNGYARVAGGGTPRPKMAERFRNRYMCKFSYMKSNFNTIGCTGCGRCTDVCPAKIDFRRTVSYLDK